MTQTNRRPTLVAQCDREERTVLGQILKDEACYNEAGLEPEHFFAPPHQEIMRAMRRLKQAGSSIDVISVADALGANLDAIGGYAYLGELELGVVTTSNVATHAATVRDRWLQRQISLVPSQLTAATGTEQLQELRDRVDYLSGLTCLTPPTLRESYEQEKESILTDMERIAAGEELAFGLNTGLGIEGVVPGGIPFGKLTLLFGESGNYKTTAKNNILAGAARLGPGKLLDVSLEDANRLATQRFIASHTGVNYGRIATRKLTPADVGKLTTLGEAALAPADRIILGGDLPPKVDKIIDLARDLKRKVGLVAVCIDYIQMLDEYVYGGHQGLAAALGKLQRAAKRDDLAYILISQVSKDVDERSRDKKRSTRPSMEDLFGSSFLKFNSKLGIGVYRPWKYEKVPKASRRQGDPDYTRLFNEHPDGHKLYSYVIELWINKNILGEVDVCVLCMVNPSTGKMVRMPDELKEMCV